MNSKGFFYWHTLYTLWWDLGMHAQTLRSKRQQEKWTGATRQIRRQLVVRRSHN